MAAADWTAVPLPPDVPCPSKRSAHVLCNRHPGSVASPRALLVHGGETEGGGTCGDSWLCDLDDLAAGRPFWRLLESGGTPRSNHAAAVVGNELFVFGGVWARRRALARMESLDLQGLRWEVLGEGGGEPAPRWNPTMVDHEGRLLVTFGGYDGCRQFDDLACFCLQARQWRAPARPSAKRPPAMTDHAAAVVGGSMVVVGGTHTTVALDGVYEADRSPHVWVLDLAALPNEERWERAECGGEAPLSCTSHTATAVGGKVLVAGGQHCWRLAALQCHVLDVGARSWSCFGAAAPGICRHAGVFADGFLMLFGGHDGKRNTSDLLRLPLSGLMAGEEAKVSPAEMFQVEQKPLALEDLPLELVAKRSARQLIGLLHKEAVARGLDMYVDPLSGYPAFTALYLKRRECCGNGCRHCPYGHKNVVKAPEW